MNSLHTHYDTLMVSRNASPEVIRAAFKSLSQKYHPDKNNHPNADQIMQQFNDENNFQYDFDKTDHGSGRRSKVVVINIPDSISLDSTKEKIRKFTASKPKSATHDSKVLKIFLNLIITILILTLIVLLTWTALSI